MIAPSNKPDSCRTGWRTGRVSCPGIERCGNPAGVQHAHSGGPRLPQVRDVLSRSARGVRGQCLLRACVGAEGG